jgi:hypothetical protein
MEAIMSRTTLARRALIFGALAGATVIALPTAASATALGWGGTLHTGQEHCISAYASTQVRADGQATGSGAKFRVFRDGTLVYGTPTGTTAGFAYEGRTSLGTFAGSGTYMLCAKNNNAPDTLVNIHVFTDADLPY